ncbi:hypothetical protein F0A17_01775 [Billgrantia pellis]|uniref:Uncharacterized protein n=1 Tax=Billgrantia pellis TaxID=2606936 RepID=A0A7V7KJS6_9GAMM|nr:hypothetical protein [Halomonas pellis]KAA0014403.1 hypothetical protein F0A17_01775 [Halomonas pellis]
MANTITTIEEALESAGKQLSDAQTSQLARATLAKGASLEIITVIRPAKQGAVVSQEARDCVITKFPTYIRLK